MKNSLKTIQVFLLAAVLLSPMAVLAQVTPPAPAVTVPTTLPTTGINSFPGLLAKACQLLNYVFAILVLIAIIFIFVAAFKYLTAGGEPEKVSSANKTLIYAAVAIAVGLLAKGIPFIVGGLLGIPQGGFFAC